LFDPLRSARSGRGHLPEQPKQAGVEQAVRQLSPEARLDRREQTELRDEGLVFTTKRELGIGSPPASVAEPHAEAEQAPRAAALAPARHARAASVVPGGVGFRLMELAPGFFVTRCCEPGSATSMDRRLIDGAPGRALLLHEDIWLRMPGAAREQLLDAIPRADAERGFALLNIMRRRYPPDA
jgi:hypothetical protein